MKANESEAVTELPPPPPRPPQPVTVSSPVKWGVVSFAAAAFAAILFAWPGEMQLDGVPVSLFSSHFCTARFFAMFVLSYLLRIKYLNVIRSGRERIASDESKIRLLTSSRSHFMQVPDARRCLAVLTFVGILWSTEVPPCPSASFCPQPLSMPIPGGAGEGAATGAAGPGILRGRAGDIARQGRGDCSSR